MWENFVYIFVLCIVCWVAGLVVLYRCRLAWVALTIYGGAFVALVFFIVQLWIASERPPIRTIAETRLWYSTFLPLIGMLMYLLYGKKWMCVGASAMSAVFLLLIVWHPDTLNKALMPALLSYWFIPHVVVYLCGYALLAMAACYALWGLVLLRRRQSVTVLAHSVHQLIFIGYSFLTFGMVFGALWAKEAWGHYWTWDPKETWAFITWASYLVYLHVYFRQKIRSEAQLFYIVIVAFGLLLICWFGVNYLPTAAQSVHTYTG